MTEITRVPLQPLAKGSMSKLWLGVLAAALGGSALAFVAKPPSVSVDTIQPGTGAAPALSDVVLMSYKGQLANGTVFDASDAAALPVTGVIPGFTKALVQTKKGGKYVFHIPASLGYGDKAAGPIPANSDLTFTVEIKDIMDRATFERQRQMMMEQMSRAHGAKGGADMPSPDAMPAQ